jgi:hypothetical protein
MQYLFDEYEHPLMDRRRCAFKIDAQKHPAVANGVLAESNR